MAPNNPLPIHGNEKTMNMNSLILTNIQASPYFKVNLYDLKTYHEVIDEIYYKVSHLEPWEKGSRKTAGQTGMCGGVRGVGAGGIVSSAYCLLYKLFTLRLTRKQVMGLCNHGDSPYIRGLGFMYIRYTQNPADFWDWYEEYLEDEEEIDVKAGGGHSIKIGEMLRQWLSKLEWYSTLFPRIPVPVQKSIEQKLKQYDLQHGTAPPAPAPPVAADNVALRGGGEPARNRDSPVQNSQSRSRRPTPPFNIAKEFEKSSSRHRSRERERSRDRDRNRSRDRERDRDRDRHRDRSRDRDRKSRRSRSRDRHRRSKSRDRKERRRSRSRDRKRDKRSPDSHRHKHKHRSRSQDRHRDRRETSFERDLKKEKDRQKRHKDDYY